MKKAMVLGGCQVALICMAASGCGSSDSDGTSTTGPGTVVSLGGASGSYPGGTKVLTRDQLDDLRGAACTGWSREPELAPAMLQFVIDKSTSMNESAPSTGGQSKWVATRDALLATYPTLSPSLGIGEFFFPNESSGCVDPNGPLAVDLARLTDAQVTALMDGVRAVPTRTDIQGTPTHDAWREGVRRLEAALANPPAGLAGAKGYVVLMTDGMPVRALNCASPLGGGIAVNEAQFDELIQDVDATTASTGVRTFVIGVPGSENDNQVPWEPGSTSVRDYVPRTKLSEVAVAGGTAPAGCSTTGPNYCHFDMTQQSDFGRALQDQLTAIAGAVAGCIYTLPTPPAGQTIDPNAVNAVYTTSGGVYTLLLRAGSENCEQGWYYSADGTEVHLCRTTCDQVKADTGASFELLFGCATVTTIA